MIAVESLVTLRNGRKRFALLSHSYKAFSTGNVNDLKKIHRRRLRYVFICDLENHHRSVAQSRMEKDPTVFSHV